MNKQNPCGFLILDRKGEYIKDTKDQKGNTVFGLHHHPKARERMVVVSRRDEFSKMKEKGLILDHLAPRFSLKDIDPVDLVDFLPRGLTEQQKDLLRDYAHIPDLYAKLLAETRFGQIDKSHWFRDLPGLFELSKEGKKALKDYEKKAEADDREQMTDEESSTIRDELQGTKPAVLERAIQRIKRFCLNPYFGGSDRGRNILSATSCVGQIIQYLAQGKFVFIDMLGQHDDEYTMVAALFARRLLNHNKAAEDDHQVRACIVMEEAHNILSEEELAKGDGRGSVFVEFAREGRSFKVGFVLVTQQPDARSIAPEVVKTIDTVIAFNMPPEDAKHLPRLKSAFTGLDGEIANAREFQGIAVADGGPVFFKSAPVDINYMRECAAGELEKSLQQAPGVDVQADDQVPPSTASPTLADRLTLLTKQRQANIGPVALETMRIWKQDAGGAAAKTGP